MAKGVRVKIRMVSTAETGSIYYETKNPRTATAKRRRKRFDPRAIHPVTGKPGAHVEFEEKKMPPHKK